MRMSTKELIRKTPTKELLYMVNKIRKEEENKKRTGDYGTGRWVSESEFWQGHHQDLKTELERRKERGEVSHLAGMVRTKRRNSPFGFGWP